MIHFTCDSCKQTINTERDLRYVLKIEVYAALDSEEEGCETDRDHLEEIQDILERLDDDDDSQLGADVYQHVRYDLCTECRGKFMRNPLGRHSTTPFDFSKN